MRKTMGIPLRDSLVRPALWGMDQELREVIKSWEDFNWGQSFIEKESQFLLSLDLPGVGKDSLEVFVEGDFLFIEGKRKNLFSEKEEVLKRKVALPKKINKDSISAQIKDGVLYLTLPKAEEAKPRRIEVTDVIEPKLAIESDNKQNVEVS